MSDLINKRYGITDGAIAAEVVRLLPAMRQWGKEDEHAHPSQPLSDAEIANRQIRRRQAKASAAIESLLPTASTEAVFVLFDQLKWNGDKRRRYIAQAFKSGILPAPA